MTPHPNPSPCEVTQEDREAAADAAVRGFDYRRGSAAVQRMLDGQADLTPIVQAFARHRIAALSQPQPDAVRGVLEGVLRDVQPAWDMMIEKLEKAGVPLAAGGIFSDEQDKMEQAGRAFRRVAAALSSPPAQAREQAS